MRHGWLDTDLIAILLVAALIAALRLLLPAGAHGGNGRMPKAALLVLVVIGALAVAVVLLSGPTQWTMVPTMMGG